MHLKFDNFFIRSMPFQHLMNTIHNIEKIIFIESQVLQKKSFLTQCVTFSYVISVLISIQLLHIIT